MIEKQKAHLVGGLCTLLIWLLNLGLNHGPTDQ